MFTPHIPRLFFILLLTVGMLILPRIGIGQNVKLYPLADYETSLRTYHTAKVRVLCAEFTARTKTKTKWWYYLPNIGVQFGLPSMNVGTNQLISIDQTRQQSRVKLASIMSQGLLDYQTDPKHVHGGADWPRCRYGTENELGDHRATVRDETGSQQEERD